MQYAHAVPPSRNAGGHGVLEQRAYFSAWRMVFEVPSGDVGEAGLALRTGRGRVLLKSFSPTPWHWPRNRTRRTKPHRPSRHRPDRRSDPKGKGRPPPAGCRRCCCPGNTPTVGPSGAGNVSVRGTPGFSGADLINLVNEAALMAARRNKRMVTQAEFEDAKDKVMMGAERKSLVMTEEEKLLTAYHEGGHAIVAINVKATDPVHKATIIPRGRALGMVMQLPERDKLSMSREQMTSRLAIMMGGRVAEEMVFGQEKVTSGAASDIEQATKLARMMVTRWGLSDELGTVAYGENQDEVFLGYQVSRQQNISEETSRKIDGEIRRLVEAGYAEATQILTDKRADLEVLAKGLLEFETLTGEEITDLLAGKRPVREVGDRAEHAAIFRRASGWQAASAARAAFR